jgi:hypothetical protein
LFDGQVSRAACTCVDLRLLRQVRWPLSPQLRHCSTALPLCCHGGCGSNAAILQRRQVLSVRVLTMPTEDKHIRTNFATAILSLCHKNCCIDGWGCCVINAGKAARAPSVAAHSMSRCCSSPTAPESQNSHVRCCRGNGGLCNLPASMGRLCDPSLRRKTA